MRNILIAISFIGVLMVVAVSHASFVDADRCRGDCTPPTLGVTDDGRRIIENGFVINDIPFNVESYLQAIPTQVFSVGDKVLIKITAHEDTGIGNVRHVTLTISDYENKREYQDKVKIAIERSFEGIVSRNIADPTGLLDNVDIKAERIDDFTGTLTISFVVAKPFDTSSITVRMWDAGLSTSDNIFEDAIQVIGKEVVMPEQKATEDKTTPTTKQDVNPKEAKVKKKMEEQQKIKEEKIKKALENMKKLYKAKGK
jgi:hypothetical protein